jgi:replicative DNA helicase
MEKSDTIDAQSLGAIVSTLKEHIAEPVVASTDEFDPGHSPGSDPPAEVPECIRCLAMEAHSSYYILRSDLVRAGGYFFRHGEIQGWLFPLSQKQAVLDVFKRHGMRAPQLRSYPIPSGYDFDTYRQANSDDYFRKQVTTIETAMQKAGADIPMLLRDRDDLLEELRARATDTQDRTVLSDYETMLEPLTEELIRQELQESADGIPLGFSIGNINMMLPPAAISIIAGATGHGKTVGSVNFILNALETNPTLSVAYFSFEQRRADVAALFISAMIGEDISSNNRRSIKRYLREKNSDYTRHQKRALLAQKTAEFFDLCKSGRLRIYYREYDASQLVGAIRYLKEKAGVGLVAIDYMQMLRLAEKRGGSRVDELKSICAEHLRPCAIDTGLPILINAQFNREVQVEADMSKTKLGEAGDIERVGNLIIGIWNRGCVQHKDGNKDRKGNVVAQEPAVILEVLKGRDDGDGHWGRFAFDGNAATIELTGAAENQLSGHEQAYLDGSHGPIGAEAQRHVNSYSGPTKKRK